PRLWIPQVWHTTDPTSAFGPAYPLRYYRKPVSLPCAPLAAIISSRPGAAWPAQVVHSPTATNICDEKTISAARRGQRKFLPAGQAACNETGIPRVRTAFGYLIATVTAD